MNLWRFLFCLQQVYGHIPAFVESADVGASKILLNNIAEGGEEMVDKKHIANTSWGKMKNDPPPLLFLCFVTLSLSLLFSTS